LNLTITNENEELVTQKLKNQQSGFTNPSICVFGNKKTRKTIESINIIKEN